jgi:hypothetical protein
MSPSVLSLPPVPGLPVSTGMFDVGRTWIASGLSLQRDAYDGFELHPEVPAPGTLSAPQRHLGSVYPDINPS